MKKIDDYWSRRNRRVTLRWLFATLIMLAFMVLAACGSPMTQGTVTGSDHQAARAIMIPKYTCNGSSCSTIMIPAFVPEHWIINLDDGSNKGAIEVSQDVYDRCLIGERYPLCAQRDSGDTRA